MNDAPKGIAQAPVEKHELLHVAIKSIESLGIAVDNLSNRITNVTCDGPSSSGSVGASA